jgi:hypothetical protein
MAMLDRLYRQPDVAVWPFQPEGGSRVVLVEVFPRIWLDPGMHKEDPAARARQIRAWREHRVTFEAQTELVAAASPDALDAVAAAINLARTPRLPTLDELPAEAEDEGWVVGAAPAASPTRRACPDP